ncbi:MAG: TIGR04423 family type III CRISPR-associated protein [Marinifilaceae bacterium]
MNKYYKVIDKLSDIPSDKEFIGYYWMSNQDAPEQVDGKFINPQESSNPQKSNNPYIVEGNLYCEEEGVSISIRNTGDEVRITQFNVAEAKAANKEIIQLVPQSYIAHRLPGKKKVCFQQAWIAEPDANCEGMPVLQPAWRAFVGFDTNENIIKKRE